jgi:hypothetical protein
VATGGAVTPVGVVGVVGFVGFTVVVVVVVQFRVICRPLESVKVSDVWPAGQGIGICPALETVFAGDVGVFFEQLRTSRATLTSRIAPRELNDILRYPSVQVYLAGFCREVCLC